MNAPRENEVIEAALDASSVEVKKTLPKRVDGEFKITVRKLEIPVRPRGVLAE